GGARGGGGGVDRGVGGGGVGGVHGGVDGALELVGRGRLSTGAAECFRDLVVTRALDEDGRGRIRTAGGIGVGSAINAVVVEHDDADRQPVAADRFHFHAGETEGAVAFDPEPGFAALDARPVSK